MTVVIRGRAGIVHAWVVTVRPTLRPGVFLLMAALVALQSARAEHVHPAGIEGRTSSLVHTHLVDVAPISRTRAYAAHGDHRLAIFLPSIYESVIRNPPIPPEHPALPRATYHHEPRTDFLRILTTDLEHDPPGIAARPCAGRAPPPLTRP
jgi:hypothetical protein